MYLLQMLPKRLVLGKLFLRLGQVRLGHMSHWAGGQRHGLAWVRVMVHTVKLFPRSHHTLSILRLGQVRLGHTASLHSVVKRKAKHLLGKAPNPRRIIVFFCPKDAQAQRTGSPQHFATRMGGIRVWDPPESPCSILGPQDHWYFWAVFWKIVAYFPEYSGK